MAPSTITYNFVNVTKRVNEGGPTVMLDGQGADEQLAGYHAFCPVRLGALLRGGRFLAAHHFAHAVGHADANIVEMRSATPNHGAEGHDGVVSTGLGEHPAQERRVLLPGEGRVEPHQHALVEGGDVAEAAELHGGALHLVREQAVEEFLVGEVVVGGLSRPTAHDLRALQDRGRSYLHGVEAELRGALAPLDVPLDPHVAVSSDWPGEIIRHAGRTRAELVLLGSTERTIRPPYATPMHWWPRHTPSVGTDGPSARISCVEMPASVGVQGPGDTTRWVGFRAAASFTVSESARSTRTRRPSSRK